MSAVFALHADVVIFTFTCLLFSHIFLYVEYCTIYGIYWVCEFVQKYVGSSSDCEHRYRILYYCLFALPLW